MLAAARVRARRDAFAAAPAVAAVLAVARDTAPRFVCGDIERAAVRAACAVDLVWSNLALQWVNDLPRALAEFRRVLTVGGLLSFTTFGPDTLKELRAAFAGSTATRTSAASSTCTTSATCSCRPASPIR